MSSLCFRVFFCVFNHFQFSSDGICLVDCTSLSFPFVINWQLWLDVDLEDPGSFEAGVAIASQCHGLLPGCGLYICKKYGI